MDIILFLAKSMNGLVSSLTQVTVPGTAELTFTETGTYEIFVEMSPDGQFIKNIAVTLNAKKTGAPIRLLPVTSHSLYYREGRLGYSNVEFLIHKPGSYILVGYYRDGSVGRPGTLTIGHNWDERFSNMLIGGGFGFLGWVTVAGVVAALPYLRRRSPAVQPKADETRTVTEAESAAPSEAASVHSLRFHGTGSELFGIFVFNVLYTICTLGVYSFWAKVKTRQYLWGQTEFVGDRFWFHGTGRELLIGWLKAAALFGGLVLLTNTLIPMVLDEPWAILLGQIIFLGGFILLLPLAIIGTMRYRLSRTSWRGVRFSFQGGYRELLGIMARGFLFTGVSVGLYFPVYQTNMRRFQVNHSHFGSSQFAFDGDGTELLGQFILTLLLTIPTLGLIWIWYFACQRRYYWNHTSFADARFHSTVTAGGLLSLYTVNLILIVISLGLAIPWASVRTKRYDADTLTLQGPLDLDHITQQAQSATPTGEELSGFLDVDALPG